MVGILVVRNGHGIYRSATLDSKNCSSAFVYCQREQWCHLKPFPSCLLSPLKYLYRKKNAPFHRHMAVGLHSHHTTYQARATVNAIHYSTQHCTRYTLTALHYTMLQYTYSLLPAFPQTWSKTITTTATVTMTRTTSRSVRVTWNPCRRASLFRWRPQFGPACSPPWRTSQWRTELSRAHGWNKSPRSPENSRASY